MADTSKDIVIRLLKRNTGARNSDMQLFLDYMQEMGMKLSPTQQWVFLHLPFDMETITRTRRVIQNDEKQLEATATVKKARLKKEIDIREKRLTRQWIFNPDSGKYREVVTEVPN